MSHRIVYLVDDDPAVRHSTGFLLQSLGIQFEAFADPAEFLAAIDRLRPGCVVTDLRMPGMNGCELRLALEDRSVRWPVVLMSSEPGLVGGEGGASPGFAGRLCKPFSADELAAMLETCFNALDQLGAGHREPPGR